MKISLAVVAIALALSGCETNPKKYNYLPVSEPVYTPPAIKDPTEKQKKASKLASDEYFDALLKTIIEIDDGNTSPEVIAKVAVGKNIELLRKMDEAKTVHISESSYLAKKSVKKMIYNLPSSSDINLATYMVLSVRKDKNTECRSSTAYR